MPFFMVRYCAHAEGRLITTRPGTYSSSEIESSASLARLMPKLKEESTSESMSESLSSHRCFFFFLRVGSRRGI